MDDALAVNGEISLGIFEWLNSAEIAERTGLAW